MADQHNDPSGNTEAFQAFVHRAATRETEVARKRPPIGVMVGAIVAVIIVTAVVWYLAVR